MTLHIILTGVGGTIYNKYTIAPLINLGLTKQKAESLASQLRDHAIQKLSTVDDILSTIITILSTVDSVNGGDHH